MQIHLVNKPIVLFDASCFLYIHGNNPDYKRSLKDHIAGTLENLNTDRYIGFIDGKGNYRYQVAVTAPYKGNRNKDNILDKFPYFYKIKQELQDTYNFQIINGIEADDLAGILNERINTVKEVFLLKETMLATATLTSYKSIIATIDKDLKQLNSIHYNLTKHVKEISTDSISYIKLSEARNKIIGVGYKFLYAQVLMGDSTDNIKGLEKCGPVKAYSILKDATTERECRKLALQAFFSKEEELSEKHDLDLTTFELWTNAKNKFREMLNLVFILRQNIYLDTVKVQVYIDQL